MSTPTRIVVGARETIRLAASGRTSVKATTAAAQGVAGPTGPAGPLRPGRDRRPSPPGSGG